MNFMKRGILSVVTVLLVVVVVGILVRYGPAATGPIFGISAESRDTRIVTAIERQDQIVLLSTSTQGLAEDQVSREIFGRDLPGTGRTQFLQYSYRAKLGVEGSEVSIVETGEDQYRVSLPDFIFIGHDNVNFKTAVEQNGVLSWVTPEIDTASTITEILSGGELTEQIDLNRDLLEDQARTFYTGIIEGIDDGVEIEFEFKRAEE
ncbi:hypothetical protein [Nesterenkonia aurantiaca]|uniref:hypothetical protein n=1 Tax=Nesterenkonia aurantiaca TaxID=1436010 RepID=UPI00105C7760|nr:hypothetical protein [Nesterenkonia aurantiaca]